VCKTGIWQTALGSDKKAVRCFWWHMDMDPTKLTAQKARGAGKKKQRTEKAMCSDFGRAALLIRFVLFFGPVSF
jgi:hypothetical protein